MRNISFLIVAMFACSAAICQTQRITFKAPMKYPEGVAFNDKTNTFYVSSVKELWQLEKDDINYYFLSTVL